MNIRNIETFKPYRNDKECFSRKVYTTYITRMMHVEDGPGKNLPFKITSPFSLAIKMALFFGKFDGLPGIKEKSDIL
ncbi:hypothetical protein PMAC_001082 [Pneumocystis sp. 'macacae']|nr:hypothetical protein PMAC_001082 [Pneumocystis sp. 'macacae']